MIKRLILVLLSILGVVFARAQSTYDGPELRALKSDTAAMRKYQESVGRLWAPPVKCDSLYYKWLRHDTVMIYNNEDTFILTYPGKYRLRLPKKNFLKTGK
jgi:hypothetical protein